MENSEEHTIKTKILDPVFRRKFVEEIYMKIEIEEKKNGKEPVSCIELVLEMCEKYEIEPEAMNGFLPDKIKDKLRTEGEKKKLLKPYKKSRSKNKLPLE